MKKQYIDILALFIDMLCVIAFAFIVGPFISKLNLHPIVIFIIGFIFSFIGYAIILHLLSKKFMDDSHGKEKEEIHQKSES